LMEELPFIGATCDAWAEFQSIQVPVELKNVGQWMAAEWYEDQTPMKFQVQCQQQLICTKTDSMFIQGLIGGGKPVIRQLHRNDEFCTVMLTKLAEFWKFVLRKELPRDFIAWESDATSDAIKRLHPDDNGETILLDKTADDLVNEWNYYKERKEEAEEFETAAKNKLCAALGANTFATLPSGRVLSLKTTITKDELTPRKGKKYRTLREVKAKEPKPSKKGK
jgi:predicted phage-related endonuclease